MTIKLIVGLSNPGTKYSLMRHNAGAWYVNLLAKRFKGTFRKESKFYGLTSCINLSGKEIHLLIPTTFMNLSGKSVSAIAGFHNIKMNEILVAHDELDLPPGIARFKFSNRHGSHNGLKDIVNKLNNGNKFHRLRVGIGHPGDKKKVVNFVLEKPSVIEQKLIDKAINESVHCTEIWLQKGLVTATSRLHAFKAE